MKCLRCGAGVEWLHGVRASESSELLGRSERAEARVKELEKWRDAVLRIVDSLDDPPSGLTWDGEPQGTCAAELGYLRSVLVPLVRGEGGEDE